MIDKKRIIFLDVLRLTAFFLVFFYHFLVRIAENGICLQETVQRIYEHPNFHIATFGVSLFFMLSGAGLMLSANHKWEIKSYFIRRIERIMIPFYIAYAGVFVLMCFMKKGAVYEKGIPGWHFLFTVAGVDGYLKEFGIPTFSLGVGEWFLGCLIIMYLLFPLLKKWMQKKPWLCVCAAGVVYIVLVSGIIKTNLPVHMNFGVKLYEFILGMFLVQYLNTPKKIGMIFAVPIFTASILLPFSIPVPEGIRITMFTLSVVILVLQMESFLEKRKVFGRILNRFGSCSFEMYLIHHWVIIAVTGMFAEKIHHPVSIVILFLLELFITFWGALAVKYIAQAVSFCYNKLLKI